MSEQNGHGFTRERMRELSGMKDEPEWLRERREASFQAWENIPMPTMQDEEWRRTDISRIDFDRFFPFARENGKGAGILDVLPDATKSLVNRTSERGGFLVQDNSTVELTEASDALKDKGVIFMSMEDAAREHPDLVQEYFFRKAMTPEYSKFAALNGAFWSGGAFLYVPKNVEVNVPFEAFFNVDEENLGLFQHNLIVLEENARAEFVEVYQSPNDTTEVLNSGVTEIYLKANADLNFASLQNWGDNFYDLSNKRAYLERDARMTWVVSTFGGKITKNHIDTVCDGEGAEVNSHGLYFLDDHQHLDTGILLRMDKPHCSGHSIFRGALKGKSRSVFQGLIKIARGAQQTDADLSNKNLLLSTGARADAIPVLEIQADDVKAMHGATVGRIDERQMFYLKSRGLSHQQAERLIVIGYFESILKHIGSESTVELIQQLIQQKIEK